MGRQHEVEGVRARLQELALVAVAGAGPDDAHRAQLKSFAINHVVRTVGFLEWTLHDFESAQSAFMEVNEKLTEAIRRESEVARGDEPGSRPMTPELVALFEENGRRNGLVQLRIETFYFFARRLLDEVAVAIDSWLGPAQTTIGSHKRLAANLPALLAEREMNPPDRFLDLADTLTIRVKMFRDKHVAHVFRPDDFRKWRGLQWGEDRRLQLSIGWLYPRPEDDSAIVSDDLFDLVALIVNYLDELASLLAASNERTTTA